MPDWVAPQSWPFRKKLHSAKPSGLSSVLEALIYSLHQLLLGYDEANGAYDETRF